MQWLLNALVTDDDKKGGGAIAPYLKHISSQKSNFQLSYRDRVSAKIFSRHWLANKRKKILEGSSPLNAVHKNKICRLSFLSFFVVSG